QIRYIDTSNAIKILVRGLGICLGLYGLSLGSSVPRLDPTINITDFQNYAWLLVVVCTVLSLFRPAFAAVPIIFVVFHKEISRYYAGAEHLGRNDYLPLVEVGLFLVAATCTIGLLKRGLALKTPEADSTAEDSEVAHNHSISIAIVLAVAIGAHFGNYFQSGVAKIILDGGVQSWALENPTSSLMLAGYNLGTNPLSVYPPLFGFIYTIFREVDIVSNIVTLAFQFFCFLAFFRVRYIIVTCLFFDVMHVAIFLLTGALFLPWIILNSLIVAACFTVRADRLPNIAIVLGVIATILGNTVFYNAKLGWYDSRQIRAAYFTAVDAEGREHVVPSNFYMSASYLLLVRHFGYFEHKRASKHVPTSAWGQIGIGNHHAAFRKMSDHSTMKLTKTCSYPLETNVQTVDFDPEKARSFIVAHHAWAIQQADEDGKLAYDLYPHHHFSMPIERFEGFRKLDLRDIVAYHYNVETSCLDWKGGAFQKEIMAKTRSEPIVVKRP
ncbi:MAG: hypothetical protein AAFO75_05535, partial [Pseudomonadota bacterium]